MAAFTQHNHISSPTFPMHPPPTPIQYPAANVAIPYAEPPPLNNLSNATNENIMTQGSSGHCCGSHSCFRLGYKFCPSDQQLILNFLLRKVSNQSLPANEIIDDVDIYQYHPSDLAEMFKQDDEEEEKQKWYFFTRRSRKKRQNRKVQNIGFWKATGSDKNIIYARRKSYNDKFYGDIVCGDIIGTKRALGFHEGSSSKAKKTSWIMYEYKLNADPKKTGTANDMKLNDWVLCWIYHKGKSFTRSSDHDDENEPLSLHVEELPSIQHDRHEFQLHDNQVPHEYFTINGGCEIVGVPQLTLVSPSENPSNFNNHNQDPFAWELENYINIGEIWN